MVPFLTLRNELSDDTHVLTKQEVLLERGGQAESRRVKNSGELLCMWLTVSGFMVMGLVSGLSLANHSDSESFLVAHALCSQDGCQWEGFWEVVGHVASPFDLSQILLVGGGLLAPCSSLGPPVIKQLTQMLTMVSGQGEWFQSVLCCAKALQSCPTLCNPMDCSPSGYSVHGILHSRILEWVAILSSRGSSQPRDRTRVSCIAGGFFTIWATMEALQSVCFP